MPSHGQEASTQTTTAANNRSHNAPPEAHASTRGETPKRAPPTRQHLFVLRRYGVHRGVMLRRGHVDATPFAETTRPSGSPHSVRSR